MGKAIGQFFGLAAAFFGTWYLLSNVDFLTIFRIESLTKENERKLAELILENVRVESREVERESIRALVDTVKKRLCDANGISDSSVTLHIVVKDDVNAFALPQRHLVVTTGLLSYCNSAEELSGVLAHEIAHIEQGDIMKKLVREVGLAMLLSAAGGEASGRAGREIVHLLSSTAFDREQERGADLLAVHMMAKAGIDPAPFAELLFRLSHEKGEASRQFEWLSTHPNSQDRASEIFKLRKLEQYRTIPLVPAWTWKKFRSDLSDVAGEKK